MSWSNKAIISSLIQKSSNCSNGSTLNGSTIIIKGEWNVSVIIIVYNLQFGRRRLWRHCPVSSPCVVIGMIIIVIIIWQSGACLKVKTISLYFVKKTIKVKSTSRNYRNCRRWSSVLFELRCTLLLVRPTTDLDNETADSNWLDDGFLTNKRIGRKETTTNRTKRGVFSPLATNKSLPSHLISQKNFTVFFFLREILHWINIHDFLSGKATDHHHHPILVDTWTYFCLWWDFIVLLAIITFFLLLSRDKTNDDPCVK